MLKINEISIVAIIAILFTFLFYNQDLGLNILIFESILFLWFILSKQFAFKNFNQKLFGLGYIFTSISTVVIHSTLSYFVHFLALLVFIGVLNYAQFKSITTSLNLSFHALFLNQFSFIAQLINLKFRGINIGKLILNSKIFFIPFIIIILFISIYRNSNPIFDTFIGNIYVYIEKSLNFIFLNLNFAVIFTFLIGLIFSNFFLLKYKNDRITNTDFHSKDDLTRMKNQKAQFYKTIALKNEYKSGLFLLAILNIILLIVNVIDINWVWFNFKWEGQYLKQFVHEGTYLLILSIIISITLVLFYFRRNLNFYKENKILKQLSYIWLIQNGVLAISVGIRNFWYINYFSLAYKRIGVFIFLALTIYGLYTVFLKVKDKKTSFFLVRKNSLSIYLALVFCSFIDWDSFIAKYNFDHSDRSFLHLNYVSSLSEKSLPYLDKPLSELKRIDYLQASKFHFEEDFMTPEIYFEIISSRKIEFKKEWESKGILSWNLAEYLAYQKLFEK